MSMQRFGMHMTMNAPLSMPSKLKNCPLTNLAVNNSKEYGLFGKQIYDKKIVNSSFIKRRCCQNKENTSIEKLQLRRLNKSAVVCIDKQSNRTQATRSKKHRKRHLQQELQALIEKKYANEKVMSLARGKNSQQQISQLKQNFQEIKDIVGKLTCPETEKSRISGNAATMQCRCQPKRTEYRSLNVCSAMSQLIESKAHNAELNGAVSKTMSQIEILKEKFTDLREQCARKDVELRQKVDKQTKTESMNFELQMEIDKLRQTERKLSLREQAHHQLTMRCSKLEDEVLLGKNKINELIEQIKAERDTKDKLVKEKRQQLNNLVDKYQHEIDSIRRQTQTVQQQFRATIKEQIRLLINVIPQVNKVAQKGNDKEQLKLIWAQQQKAEIFSNLDDLIEQMSELRDTKQSFESMAQKLEITEQKMKELKRDKKQASKKLKDLESSWQEKNTRCIEQLEQLRQEKLDLEIYIKAEAHRVQVENKQCGNEKDLLSQRIATLTKENQKLQVQLSQAKHQYIQIIRAKASIENTLQQTKELAKQTQEEAEQQKQQSQQKVKTIESLKLQIQEFTASLQTLRQDNLMKKKKIDSFVSANEIHQTFLAEKQKNILLLKESIRRLQGQIDQLQEKSQATALELVKEQKERLEIQKEVFNCNLRQLEKDLEQKNRTIEELKATIEDLKATIRLIKQQTIATAKEFQQYRDSVSSISLSSEQQGRKCVALARELQIKQYSLKELQEQNEHLMCEIASVSSNCKDWEAQINRDSSMIDQLRQEILEKQCKLETKSLECRAIKLQKEYLAKDTEQKIQDLKKEIEKQEQIGAEERRQNDKLKSNLLLKQQQLQQTRQILSVLEDDSHKTKSEFLLCQKQQSVLIVENRELSEKKFEMEKQQLQQSSLINKLRNEMHVQQVDYSKLLTKIQHQEETRQKQIKQISKTSDSRKEEIGVLKSKINDLLGECKLMQAQLQVKDHEVAYCEQKVKKLQEVLQDNHQLLTMEKDERDKLIGDIVNREAHIARKEEQLKECQTESTRMGEKIKRLEDSLQQARNEQEVSAKKLQYLQKECEDKGNKHRKTEQDYLALQKEYQNQNITIKVLRQENYNIEKLMGEQIQQRKNIIQQLMNEKKLLYAQIYND